MTKIVAFGGSLRKGSYSRMTLEIATAAAKEAGADVEVLELKDYQMPPYDGDLEEVGMPEVVEKFKAKIAAADGIIFSSPEYNHSIPGYLKNMIDWASRKTPELKDVFQNKTLGLITSSDGNFGGVRAAIAWLPTFKTLGLVVYPPQLPVPYVQNNFDSEGKLLDNKLQEKLTKFARGFVEFTQKSKS